MKKGLLTRVKVIIIIQRFLWALIGFHGNYLSYFNNQRDNYCSVVVITKLDCTKRSVHSNVYSIIIIQCIHDIV